MRYDSLQNLTKEEFRRLTGVKPQHSSIWLKFSSVAHKVKRWHGGRSSKFSVEDLLMITLEYLRKYRTYFHIWMIYEISESSAYKTIKLVGIR